MYKTTKRKTAPVGKTEVSSASRSWLLEFQNETTEETQAETCDEAQCDSHIESQDGTKTETCDERKSQAQNETCNEASKETKNETRFCPPLQRFDDIDRQADIAGNR